MDSEQYIDRSLQDLAVTSFNSVGECISGDGKYFAFTRRGHSMSSDASN